MNIGIKFLKKLWCCVGGKVQQGNCHFYYPVSIDRWELAFLSFFLSFFLLSFCLSLFLSFFRFFFFFFFCTFCFFFLNGKGSGAHRVTRTQTITRLHIAAPLWGQVYSKVIDTGYFRKDCLVCSSTSLFPVRVAINYIATHQLRNFQHGKASLYRWFRGTCEESLATIRLRFLRFRGRRGIHVEGKLSSIQQVGKGKAFYF